MATAEPGRSNGADPAAKAPAGAPPPPPAATAAAAPAARRKNSTPPNNLLLAGLAGGVLAVYFAHGYLTRDEVKTDDAQIDADVVPVSARVAGVIRQLRVADNQRVEAGAVIARIDDADFKAKVAAAQADLDAATAQAESAAAQVEIVRSTSGGALSSARAQVQGSSASVRSASAQIDAAQAAVARASAELAKAQADLDRAKKLHDAGAVSGQALEAAQTARDAAAAAQAAAQANLAAARDQQSVSVSRVAEAQGRLQQSTPVERQIAVAEAAARLAAARVESAKAALELARLQLGYTEITAPVTGFVSKLAVREGQMVQPGAMLAMVVPLRTYVVANFKETQLARLRPGDPVDISVDALGGRELHGKVESIAAGTGARFSLMPPDNATGNFVKVVQRVPVKIAWDDGQDLSQLRAGLSVEVKIHLQHGS
jgi:membrane fusion protein (multidrug efflux system)